MISTISLREIVEIMCLSKYNLAQSAKKNPFIQPRMQNIIA